MRRLFVPCCSRQWVACPARGARFGCDIAICGVGAFEKQGRACALWPGIAPADQPSALHHKVDYALTMPGLLAKSRAYVLHIALARLARLQAAGPMIDAYLAHHAGLRSPAYAFTRMTLFESHLGHGGAHYEAVGSWPFG